MYDHRGTTALITGASSGLGERFALTLAGRGADVVLVARRRDRLERLADRIREEFGRRAVVVAADLAVSGGGVALAQRVAEAGLTVDTLVNNAGFATHGELAGEHADRIRDEVAVNVAMVVELTHAMLPAMIARGHGVIINVASTAAFQPVPFMAVYGATKAFVLSFTEAVAYETRNSAVKVLALCPGATETEFFQVVGEAASVGRRQNPQQVVAAAMAALDARRTPPSIVTGTANRAGAILPRLISRRCALAITGRLTAA